jgi:hypothetical protein
MLTFSEQDHKYYLDSVEVPSVTRVIKEAGLMGDFCGGNESAMQMGANVHLLLELEDEGQLGEYAPEYLPYLEAYRKFKADTKAVVVEIEKRVCSETYRFAGTLDRVMDLPGIGRSIVDIKSTPSAAAWHGLQTAAYQLAYNGPLVGNLGSAFNRFALYLNGEGKYKLEQHKDRRDRAVFLAALTMWWYKSEHKITELST